MSATNLQLPARRRRNARLIATLTHVIGDCAAAAGSVYGPIATAPPEQGDVSVSVWPFAALALSASTRLEAAGAEDDVRWPAAVAAEEKDRDRTFAARCVAAEAEQITADPAYADTIFSAAQHAAMEGLGVGADFLIDLLDDPHQAIDRARERAASGELTVDEILDEATDTAVLSGLLALRQAQKEQDPSTAAETCLAASRHFVLAIQVASTDIEAP
ncbi:hypothetical protein [Streptomyces sp. NPDC058595]|uniref:hypothetical protein n=1 Tax=Streptomyces sp. NPDC058595 TaxID=3346550 RepID=UPI003664D60D